MSEDRSRGAVIADEQLKVPVLLRKNLLYGYGQVSLKVIGRHAYANLGYHTGSLWAL